MSSVVYSKEQKEILELLEKYGCLDIAQLYALYEPLSRDTVNSMVDMMVRVHTVSIIDGHIIVLSGNNNVNLNALSCLWTMLKISTDRSEITKSFPASEPAYAYMVGGKQDSYIFVNVKSDETVKIRAIQEKVEKGSKNKYFRDIYIFVTTDESVKDIIKETDFKTTVYVAVLKYDRETKIPDVKLLKKNVA